jgi:hypothetical protein
MSDQEAERRVEISGWDMSEHFFVERGKLLDEQEDGKKITIHHAVRVGGLLFLRLLGNSQPSMSFPVAYRVRELRAELQAGIFEVTLRQMWPRPGDDMQRATPHLDAIRPDWPG